MKQHLTLHTGRNGRVYANGQFGIASILAFGNLRTYLLGVEQQVQLQLFSTASINIGTDNSERCLLA